MSQEIPGEAEPVSGWAGTPSERGHFRPDIEGLRALAVLAVLLYHVGVPGFGAGFIGVDVFYVISGFLITGLLRREITRTGGVDLVSFYARRARRLLPAALVVIVVTLALTVVILPRLRWNEISVDAASAALYVSNYRFALQGLDYLNDTAQSPLLHYWSLAVEEQFYLLWPILLILGARLLGPRRLGWMIVPIGVVSFIAAIVLAQVAAPIAFFSLPTRAWELAIGALLAVAPEPVWRRLPASAYRAAGWIGLALIIASAALIDPGRSYPDIFALVPTFGAALVISAGALSGGAGRWLGTAVPRWLGRISYSLYLWHWPLLILVPVAIGQNGLPIRVGLAVVAVVIAHVSTRWIEQPIRHKQGDIRGRPAIVLTSMVTASVAVAVLALGGGALFSPPSTPTISVAQIEADVRQPAEVLANPHTSGRVPDLLQRSLGWAASDFPENKRTGCQPTKLGTDPTPCISGDEDSATTVVLLGDSHAGQWLPALEQLASERGWRIAAFTKPACPPVDLTTWDTRLLRGYVECPAWLAQVKTRIAEMRPALIVVGAARHHRMFDEGRDYSVSDRPDEWRGGLERMLLSLRAVTDNVVLLADTPRNSGDPLDCLAAHPDFEDCQTSRAVALDTAYEAIETAATANTGTHLVSMSDVLCPGEVCPLAFGDYLVYRNQHHLTATFARLLSHVLADRLPSVPGVALAVPEFAHRPATGE